MNLTFISLVYLLLFIDVFNDNNYNNLKDYKRDPIEREREREREKRTSFFFQIHAKKVYIKNIIIITATTNTNRISKFLKYIKKKLIKPKGMIMIMMMMMTMMTMTIMMMMMIIIFIIINYYD